MARPSVATGIALCLTAMSFGNVEAHGFAGQPYVLPAPLGLYLLAGGLVVLLSFALIVTFSSNRQASDSTYGRLVLPWLGLPPVVATARVVGGVLGVLALLVTFAVGWFGPQDPPTANLAEYIVWIYCWALLVIVGGLLGNVWSLVNPWAALYDIGQRLSGRNTPWPAVRLLSTNTGWWPAVAGYFMFAWFELASGVSNHPAIVAWLAAGYSLFTLVMMRLFGRNAWLRHGEFFTVLFNLIGRHAPVEVRTQRDVCATCTSGCAETEGSPCINCAECFSASAHREVSLRLWAVGLLAQPLAGGWDRVAFIILTLSTLAFDGILATGAFNGILGATFPDDEAGQALIRTIGLVVLTAIFFGAFLFVVSVMQSLGERGFTLKDLSTKFALTLVPIALVYNLAHNYVYVFLVGQGGFALISDPFGKGWNVFGTRGYQVSQALTGAQTVWYAQLILIVAGHIVAVLLGHRRAASVYRSGAARLVTQYPLLLLMVVYTVTSLWILAQPITAEA